MTSFLERVRSGIDGLDWVILLILVIVADGLVGGLYRAAGKETASKVVGWVMIAAYIASVVSFVNLRGVLGAIAWIITAVRFIADLVTVIRDRKITYFAA